MGKFKGGIIAIKDGFIAILKTIFNLLKSIISGNLLARPSVERFIPHAFVLFLVMALYLLSRYWIEQTFYRLEESKEELRHEKILYTEKLYYYEQSQSIGNVLNKLEENGSKIDIPTDAPKNLDEFIAKRETDSNQD
ncbi:MAG: hypothetical protein HUJ95_04275 [Bacteroidales bacterium]|nr:hypothetical protein [Bacteroidales bacterium]